LCCFGIGTFRLFEEPVVAAEKRAIAHERQGSEKGQNMSGSKSDMELLGELICRLNPYTRRKDPSTGRSTGDMDVKLGAAGTDPGGANNPYAQVELEVDTKYAADWTFKGQAQRVNTAVRIKYRYPVLGPKDASTSSAKPVLEVKYWVEDYLLLGYEGSGGV
jgi:hypothetical protein